MKAKKPLKTKYGSPLIPVLDGALGADGHIGYWWFKETETDTAKTYVAIEDVEGGLPAIYDYLGLTEEGKEPCPF